MQFKRVELWHFQRAASAAAVHPVVMAAEAAAALAVSDWISLVSPEIGPRLRVDAGVGEGWKVSDGSKSTGRPTWSQKGRVAVRWL